MTFTLASITNSQTFRATIQTWPLLGGMFLLMLGAGLQGTLLAIRAISEGFTTLVTGMVMSCYFLGYIGGSIGTPRLIHRVGHIRVFAALSAVASVTILLQAMVIDPLSWATLRLVSGFCFAGIYIVAESWLNEHATNKNRGGLLAMYMLVLYAGLGGGQFLLNAADPLGSVLFIVISVTISLAVVPMSLSAQRAPEYEIPRAVHYLHLFRASPLGTSGVIVSGIVTGTMFSMGPVYSQLMGLGASDTALFMGMSILAAVITQLPIGKWSDRVDRRTVLIVICIVGSMAAVLASLFGHHSKALLFALAACFGGIALTLYSLAVSHINDHLEPSQMVGASGTVVLLNGVGAATGPLLCAVLLDWYGAAAYFAYLSLLVLSLAIYGLYRQSQRAPVPHGQKGPFVVAQPQTASGQMIAEIVAQSSRPHGKVNCVETSRQD